MVKKKKPIKKPEGGWYGSQYLKGYSNELNPVRTNKEIKFLLKVLAPKKGSKILDVGCGSGRHAISFSKLGYMVTGLDENSFLLNKARRKAKKENIKINFILQDMRKMSFKKVFDSAICLYTSFGYFEDEDDHLKAMKKIFNAVKNGGRFVIDVQSRDFLISRFKPKETRKLKGGGRVIHERFFDPLTSMKENRQTIFYQDGGIERTGIKVRMFSPSEMKTLGERAGFRFLSFYGDYGKKYGNDSTGIIMVFEKPV